MTEGEKRDLCALFKECREAKSLSQTEVGEAVGVAYSTIGYWETQGDAIEKHGKFVEALHMIGITASEFFGLTPPVD